MAWSRALLLGFVWLAAGGCGLVLDLDPADPQPVLDASMDSGAARDAGRAACERDIECDDDLFCNGSERCSPAGRCVAGSPPGCDDGLDCTIDSCDEAVDGCAHREDDSVCEVSGCMIGDCVAGVGCRVERSDAACDDSFECTVDICGEDGQCRHAVGPSVCPVGQICTLGEGCTSPPMCSDSTDCPARACTVGTCDGGVCRYEPDVEANGARCAHPDACVAAVCEAGVCVPRAPVVCPSSACEIGSCVSTDGGIGCALRPRADGDSCDDGDPCTGPGQCAGGVCLPGAPRCISTNLCAPMVCTPSGACHTEDVLCGANASCDVTTGRCVCAPNFDDCGTGVCNCPVRAEGVDPCVGAVCTTLEPPDAGAPDAGRPSLCSTNVVECANAGRCDCDLRSHQCVGGACIPCGFTCTDVRLPFCCPCSGCIDGVCAC